MENDNREVRLNGVRPSTIAAFEASFGAILGLFLAFMAWIGATIQYSQATASLLQGMLLGLGAGFLTLIIVPLVYAAIGWVVGYVQALIFNMVISAAGGIALSVADEPTRSEMATETPDRDVAEGDAAEQPVNPMPAGSREQPSFGESIGPRKHM